MDYADLLTTFWPTLLGIATPAFLLGWHLSTSRSRPRIQSLETSLQASTRETAKHLQALEQVAAQGHESARAVAGLTETIRELPELAQRLIASQEIREIPHLALEVVQEVFAPRYAAFFRMGREELIVVAATGATEMRVGDRVDSRTGLVGWTASKQLPLTPEDLELETHFNRHRYLGYSACEDFAICLPVLREDATIGVILVGPSSRELPHTPEIARTIALITGVSLMSARALSEQRLLAQTDGLTGLLNKVNIVGHLERLLDADEPASGSGCVSAFLFDIDHFKNYNDTNGHLAGDRLLKTLSALLQGNIREGEFVGRYGGEEFLVVLPGAGKDEALRAANRIRARIAAWDFESGRTQPKGRVTVSGGVATYPQDGRDAEVLLKKADEGLYEAKRAGRDRIVSYAPPELALDESMAVPTTDFGVEDANTENV